MTDRKLEKWKAEQQQQMQYLSDNYNSEQRAVIDGALQYYSNYDPNNPDSSFAGYSPDNIYYRDMAYARNKDELLQLKAKAIEYEMEKVRAGFSDYRDRLATENQRQYESYANQSKLMREAGINPNLFYGSGGGSGSGSSGYVHTSPVQNGDLEFTTPTEKAQTVFQGISSVASLISSVTSALNGGLSFIEGVSTLGSKISTAASNASLASDAAEVSRQTIPAQVQAAKDSSYMSHLAAVGDVAQNLPLTDEGQVDEAQIADYFKNLGIDDTSFQNAVLDYSKNPAKQKEYADNVLSARRASARLVSQPLGMLQMIEESLLGAEYWQSHAEEHLARFRAMINGTMSRQDNVDAIANDMLATNKLKSEQSLRALDLWKDQLGHLKSAVKFIDDELERIEKQPGTIENNARLYAFNLIRKHLMTLGNKELKSMYDICADFYFKKYQSDLYAPYGTAMPTSEVLHFPQFKFGRVMFSSFVNDDPSFDEFYGGLVKVIEGASAGSKVGGTPGAVAGGLLGLTQ